MATSTPTELWLQRRPWFALYGLRLKRTREGQPDDQDEHDHEKKWTAPVSLVPKEILYKIMEYCEPYTLGLSACVCKTWLAAVQNPELWKTACFEAWPTLGNQKLESALKKHYLGNWKRMWMNKPRLRYDGIYVSRNTYIRTGIVEWRVKNPVHLVCYYRYIRFFPDGQFLYKTTPSTVSKIAKRMYSIPTGKTKIVGEDAVLLGRYYFHNESVYTSMVYPGSTATEIRSKLRLRSTEPATNNRLDILSLMSYTRDSNTYIPMDLSSQDDENDALAHNRGMNTYVFVPWHRTETSELNLGIDKMDFYCPG